MICSKYVVQLYKIDKEFTRINGVIMRHTFFWIAMLFLVSGDDNIKIVNVIDFMIFEIISQILKVKSTAHKIPFVYCTLYI